MVNIVKRMRGLKPKVRQVSSDWQSLLTSFQLLTIRNGPGAAILPPPPAPQLVHVHLKAPPGYGSHVRGARQFWRHHLRRLKFYNPALPITVDYAKPLPNKLITLALRFEHKDPEILRKIPGNTRMSARKPKAQQIVRAEMSEDEKELLARQQDPNFRNAPVSWKSKEEEAEVLHQAAIDAEVSAEATTEEKATTTDMKASAEDISEREIIDANATSLFNDEVVPSAASTNVKGAATLYTRSVTLGLSQLSVQQIWSWFQQRTRCTSVEMSDKDLKERAELDLFFAQSAIDRQKVKEGREAVRKEKADLQRARGEADRLKQEAI